MIKLDKINISFQRPIFKDAKIELHQGVLNVLIGPSGSGKTTLLNEIGLLNKQLHSKYSFNNIELDSKTDFSLIRKYKIGYVFQENYLFEKLTVKENLIFSANIAGIDLSDDQIIELLKKTQTEDLLDKKIKELSGGQQQRIAISFALAKQPELLLFDEPTSYLDQENCDLVIDVIKEIVDTGKTTVFVVSHDQRIIDKADTLSEIKDAKIGIIKQKNNQIKCNNEIMHNDRFTVKAINQYIEKSRQSIYKLLYVALALILAILLFNSGYSIYYRDYVENNIINSNMEEIRIYYGPHKRYVINNIDQPIMEDVLKAVKNIEGIKEVVPFYELYGNIAENNVLIQSYSNDISQRAVKTFSNNSGIYVSNTVKGLLEGKQINLSIDNQNYKLKVNGVLDEEYVNNYSDNGNKIIYVPESKFKEVLEIDDLQSYLYILKFTSEADLNYILEQINYIDSSMTVYSSIDIDKLQVLNTQLLRGVEDIVKIILACELILIIYDKSKQILARKKELALLYANGLTQNKIIQILFLESFNYSIYSVLAADLITIPILYIVYDFNLNILQAYIILNAVFIISLNVITLITSVLLLNTFSIKTLLEE